MFYNIKLAIKNVFSRKSTIIIILFITFPITVLITINAIFDGTEDGIRAVFKSSFTGDVVIREKTKENVSLFGNVSIVDESLTPFEEVSYYNQLADFLTKDEDVASFTHQISSYVAIEYNEIRYNTAVFAVDATEYLDIMESIKIINGSPYQKGQKGVMLSDVWLKNFEDKNGKTIKVGDEVQLVFTDGKTFRIRALPVTAIYTYPVRNNVLDKIVLADPTTIRSLLGRNTIYSSTEISALENSLPPEYVYEDFDMDALFNEVSDIEVKESEPITYDFKAETQDEIISDETPINWDFLILKLAPGANDKKVIKQINNFAKQNGYTFEAISWKDGAGITVQYIYWLRTILIAGIVIVLFAGLIVVNNTLVINIVDRTREIGTMRAIGANKRNVSALCMRETLIMCLTACALSCVLATIIVSALKIFPVHLTNPFFVQLFGGNIIVPKFQADNYFQGVLVSLIVGLFSWIFPVIECLKIMPVVAMKGGKL